MEDFRSFASRAFRLQALVSVHLGGWVGCPCGDASNNSLLHKIPSTFYIKPDKELRKPFQNPESSVKALQEQSISNNCHFFGQNHPRALGILQTGSNVLGTGCSGLEQKDGTKCGSRQTCFCTWTQGRISLRKACNSIGIRRDHHTGTLVRSKLRSPI